MKPFIPFHRPTITRRHVAAVSGALRSGWLTSAGKVEEFEKLFAKRVGAKHAVAVNSCTAALHLALVGLGVGPGDRVITSPITFASAVNVIEHVGATPVFVDVNPWDLTIDPALILHFISSNTKAIIATHFAGSPADMKNLDWISEKTGIPVITDAAHAIETSYQGRLSGQLGKISCYSFYATKNITTGEGGMFTTNDEKLADRARILRLHGMTKDAWKRYGPSGYKHWDIVEPGWKYNMSDVQAALGVAQLMDMDVWRKSREKLTREYLRTLPKKAVPVRDASAEWPAYHLMVVRVPKRDLVMDEIQKRGVGVGVHFRAVHRLKYYQEKYRIPRGALPIAEEASDQVLSLPLYPSLKTSDVHRVVETLGDILK